MMIFHGSVEMTADLLTPLLSAIPLQLLAYHLATLRGHDVDQPRTWRSRSRWSSSGRRGRRVRPWRGYLAPVGEGRARWSGLHP